MDYDQTDMAGGYDRGRAYDPLVLQEWLATISRLVGCDGIDDIVDLGCGTGRYSVALADHFDARVVAVDPSRTMLEQARRKNTQEGVIFRLASGESIPVDNASSDLVFMSMVFHHFDDPAGVARECRRVLRRDGVVFLRNTTTEQIDSFPYIDFFPQIRGVIEEQLCSRQGIETVFNAAGFEGITHQIVVQDVAPNWAAFADKMSRRAESFLTRLSDRDFETGLEALRTHAEQTSSAMAVTENVDLFVLRPSPE